MNRHPVIIFLAILAAALPVQSAHLSSMEAVFDIGQDSSVTQWTTFVFTEAMTGVVNYTLSDPVRAIEVSDGTEPLEHTLTGEGGAYTLAVALKKPTTMLVLLYHADNTLFRSGAVSHFFAEFAFEHPLGNMTAQVRLPPGYVVYQNAYRPPDAAISSDGERIALTWETKDAQSAFFSVKFVRPDAGSAWTLLALLLFGAVIFLVLYFRQKTKEAFLEGFREDERRVIAYLQQKRRALQKDLESEFKFSRAKTTRIVSKLEEKGLLRKRRYGRTNRLSWLK